MAITLNPALEQELQHLAAECDLSVDELAHRALEGFVAYRRDLVDAAREGWVWSGELGKGFRRHETGLVPASDRRPDSYRRGHQPR
jgi:predicted transcriptional regulator